MYRNAVAMSLYDLIDAYGDGSISKGEFAQAVKLGPLGLDCEETQHLFIHAIVRSLADRSHKGQVTADAFVAAFVAQQEAKYVFRKADTNGDGELDKDEFVAACATGMLPISKNDADGFFARADVNGDGILDMGEFVAA